ncbi:MAG: SDR family NAD(P)-dependent oxidoreductase [bacterium]|nr:SDR family NAD(P)-dependent oxidoreductase [bacterium]
MKTYLVFGAAGSIGQEVVRQLLVAGHRVIASVREHHQEVREGLLRSGALVDVIENVADRKTIEAYASHLSELYKLDGVVYAVGHCPPNGLSDAIKHPLSQLSLDKYRNEIDMHQIGVLNVFQCMAANLENGGCFVFISSAITRLKGQFPPFLQAHYHAGVISAEDWLVDGMRHDPMIAERKIRVHRVAPAAVDTSFHHGGPKPPKLIPINTVAEEVVRALQREEVVDKQIG